MKKFKICTALIILMILAFSSVSQAGSIDVELLYDDEAKVFVGRIDDFSVTYEEQNYPNTVYNITLTPTLKIKGNVILEEALTFEEVRTGKLKLEKNQEYFFGNLKNELYIWELESFKNLFDWEKDDYKEDGLILKERHNGSIAGGIQKFLNDGSFYEAEKKRVEKANLGEITVWEFLKTDRKNATAVKLKINQKSYTLDKELFIKIAERTFITPVINGKSLDFDGIYITVENGENPPSFLYVTPDCSIDMYSDMMGRLPFQEYIADKAFLKQLYAISPKDAQNSFPDFDVKNTKTYIIHSLVIITFIILLWVGFIYLKNQKRGKEK